MEIVLNFIIENVYVVTKRHTMCEYSEYLRIVGVHVYARSHLNVNVKYMYAKNVCLVC